MTGDDVRVLVVDDVASFRRAASQVVSAVPGFVVVGEASSGEEAVETGRHLAVDLVLMDVHMPGIGGVAAAAQLLRRHPGLRVIYLSVYPRQELPKAVFGPSVQFCAKESFGPDELELLWRSPSAEV